jgi:hypothetical protein
MIIGCNGTAYTDKATTIDYTCMNAKLATMGTALENNVGYWSSNDGYSPLFKGTLVDLTETRETTLNANVRVCLAF